ncbi:MAG: TPM domain-containing protein [Candidatus Taylorbacteria bacterium]|nr:TPM domain-containing protein [Candidatus Taylorbacteria bacterium]
MKRTIALLGLCLLIASTVYGQGNYPNPIGHVNDFANIIDSATELALETQLRDYKDKTSIEIAVATVSSLKGITVDEYALELFNEWGVGDRAKDNGILVLVAPNEREMKIEVGYGMEPDLTDAQAGRIINDVIIPYFRDGKMAEGVAAGVDAILDDLGSTPFETRLEERRIAEEKKQADAKRRAEESSAFMRFAGVILAFFVLVGTPLVLVFVKIRRKKKLQAQFKANFEVLRNCENLIKKAEDSYPEAQKHLIELKGISPEEMWRPFAKALVEIPAGIKLAEQGVDDIIRLQYKNGWEKSLESYTSVAALLVTVTALSSWSEQIKDTVLKVGKARDESPTLLENTLANIKTVKEEKILEHKDVSDKTRQYLKDAENKCNDAGSLMAGSGLLSWLTIYSLIAEASSLVGKARNATSSDKAAAEEARRPKPVHRPSSRSSSSGFGSSRPRSGGGGFGGFGGGRSGGGGARGKW